MSVCSPSGCLHRPTSYLSSDLLLALQALSPVLEWSLHLVFGIAALWLQSRQHCIKWTFYFLVLTLVQTCKNTLLCCWQPKQSPAHGESWQTFVFTSWRKLQQDFSQSCGILLELALTCDPVGLHSVSPVLVSSSMHSDITVFSLIQTCFIYAASARYCRDRGDAACFSSRKAVMHFSVTQMSG